MSERRREAYEQEVVLEGRKVGEGGRRPWGRGANVRLANVLGGGKRLSRDGQTTDGQTSWRANVFNETGKRSTGKRLGGQMSFT